MELLKTQLNRKRFETPSKITSERQLILKDFLDRLNAERGKYPPITAARLGVMLSMCSVPELKRLYGDCKAANNFSKLFWWKMKQSKLSTP